MSRSQMFSEQTPSPAKPLIVRSVSDMPSAKRGCVVAIGNFDGVHRGHQAVLGKALETAREKNLTAAVLTFEPHPRTFFAPHKPVFRLTDARMKAELLGSIGFDIVFEQHFDADFSSLSADEFIDGLLLEGMGATDIVTGYDFHFGKARAGTPQYLAERVSAAGGTVHLVEQHNDEAGEVISSSRIRAALAEGDLGLANGLLGYTYRIHGTVAKGRQVGRTINYPTANIVLPEESGLAHGIYAVRVERPNGALHDGVASFGRRPTFDNGAAVFETFLFDFDGDLYGEEHTVYLYSRLRGEEKFDGVEALVEQMDKDCAEAQAVLQTLSPNHGKWPIAAGNGDS